MPTKRRKGEIEHDLMETKRELEEARRRIQEYESNNEPMPSVSGREFGSSVLGDADYDRRDSLRKPEGGRRVVVQLPHQEQYDGSRSWESFIFSFLSLAATCLWDKTEQRFRLLACLRGEAADFVFQQLSRDIVDDFDKLIAALENRFADRKTPASFVSQLETRRLGQKETIAEYAADIRKLTTFGYPTADSATLDTIATRHFIRGLCDPNMALMIGMHEPRNLQQAREIAERFNHLKEESNRHGHRPIRAISATSGQADATDGRLANFEKRLSSMDDKITEISSILRQQSLNYRGSRNFTPGRRQGMMNGGPSRDRNLPDRCHECGAIGHFARECPIRLQQQPEREQHYEQHRWSQHQPSQWVPSAPPFPERQQSQTTQSPQEN